MPLSASSLRRLALPVLLVLLAMLAFVPRSAQAQRCYVENAVSMNFGVVTPAGAQATSDIIVRCQAPYGTDLYFTTCLFLGPSADAWATVNPRRMTNYNGAYMLYDLFSDPAHVNMIGPPGSTPVYQKQVFVPSNGNASVDEFIYGLVYPDQALPTIAPFQEQRLAGQLSYVWSTTGYPATSNCAGGGVLAFDTSGFYATFANACTLTAGDLDFGEASALASAVLDTATITVNCPADATWSLGLGNGQNYAAGTRRMAGGGSYVSYGLYRDAGRTQAWGNTGPEDRYAGSTVGGAAVNVTVYGRVPTQAEVPPGHYTDTVVATLYY